MRSVLGLEGSPWEEEEEEGEEEEEEEEEEDEERHVERHARRRGWRSNIKSLTNRSGARGARSHDPSRRCSAERPGRSPR